MEAQQKNSLAFFATALLGAGMLSASAVAYLFLTKPGGNPVQTTGASTQLTVQAESGPDKSAEPKGKSTFDKSVMDQRPSIFMLHSSPSDYIGKTVSLIGYARLSSYYNWEYGDAEQTHYSVNLKQPDFEGISLFFGKERFKDLFDYLSKPNSEIPFFYTNILGDYFPIQVQCYSDPAKYNKSAGEYLGEGTSWSHYRP